MPTDTHCKIELNTVSGKIRSSLPVTSLAMGHGVNVTQVGSGGTAVRLKSVSGGLSIETEGVPATTIPGSSAPLGAPATTEQPASTVQPPAPPQPRLSTAEILERIERGEMSVDEAIKLMRDQP